MQEVVYRQDPNDPNHLLMEINFQATAKQKEAFRYWEDNETTEIWFWWAAWWAKSRLGCFAVWSSCIRYPWSRWVIWRKELVNLRRTTLATYNKVMEHYKIPERYRWILNSQTNTIKFPNWSEIILLDCAAQTSDTEWTRFWSLELTGAFVDEANEVDAKGIEMLKTRIGRQNTFNIGGETVKKHPKFLECFNPNKWHVYNDYYLPRKQGTLPPYRKFIRATAKDNKYLAPEYIEQLERSDEITKQRLLYWNFDYDDTPGKLFRWDEITDLFSANVAKDDTTYITCDVARLWDDMTVIVVRKGLEVVDIKSYNWRTTDQTVEVIRDLERYYDCRRSNICIDSDWVWCLVKWTQVMTLNGWKNIEDIQIWDTVYSKDKDWKVCLEKVNDIQTHNNTLVLESDNWYKFSKSHFLPIKTRKEHPVQMYSWDHVMKPWNWKRPKAYLLQNDFAREWKDFTFVWENTVREMPNGWVNVFNNWKTIPWAKLARLLGWFVSEWYFDGRYFCICQATKSPFNDEIDKVIADCWLKASKTQQDDEYFWKIWNRPLLEFIKKECYLEWEKHIAWNKKVPDFIKMWTKEIITAFLDWCRKWDWYIHKWAWMPYYSTSSRQLAEDVLELIYKKWWYGNIKLHAPKWSKTVIEWRIVERKQDVWCIYEYKNPNITITPKLVNQYEDTVYDMRISWDTKLFMCRFSDWRWFWSHNWWVADQLRWCVNFMNNWTPIVQKDELRNYANLKTQCYFKLKYLMEKREIRINASWEIKDKLQNELDNILIKDVEWENKVRLESKEDMKKRLGHSPDYADAIMMRMYRTLGRSLSPVTHTDIITVSFDDMLY